MDLDSAGFVIDRVDVAREALKEAQLVVGKFSQEEDDEVCRMLKELLQGVEQLDSLVKAGSYPT